MTTAAVSFLAALAIGAFLTRVVRVLGLRLGAVDHALVSRKIHRRPTPRLGGVAIVIGFFTPLVALLFVDGQVGRLLLESMRGTVALFVGGVAIAALGVFDDVRGVEPLVKLYVQLAVAALAYWAGFRIDQLALPLAPTVDLGILGVPVTVLWIVGVINAMNLIDGLDGLAAGVAVFAAAVMAVIALDRGDAVMVLCASALAGATLGFLFYNFNPASIFMGDTGSMFLGFVLATTAIRANERGSSTVALLVPIVALGLPIADTLLAMARRAARGVPLFRGDARHIHHRLLGRGFSHRKAVLILYVASGALGASAIVVHFAPAPLAFWFLLTLTGIAYHLLRRLGFFNLAVARELVERRRRNVRMRLVVRRAGESIRVAETPEEVWTQVRRVGRLLGATFVGLEIGAAGGGPGPTYSHGLEQAPAGLFRARYGLTPERPGASYVELGWNDGRASVERDMEIAIEVLCTHLAHAAGRLGDVRAVKEPEHLASGLRLQA